MNDQTIEEEIKPSAISGRSFKEYCKLLGYEAETGNDFIDKRILDVGIGNSTFARYVNANFETAEVIGMDERQIKQMASGFGEVHEPKELEFPQAQLVKGDVRSLPFADESFDEVISSNLKQYVLSKEALVKITKEMIRVCRKGGKIRITPSLLTGHNRFTKDELLGIIGKENFELSELEIPSYETTKGTTILTRLQ